MSEELTGRALDAAVSEKVMGWALDWQGDELLCPDFSTDIADAWLVVEKMQMTQGPGHVGPFMLHVLSGCDAKGWNCIWCSDFGYTESVFGRTAPEAICRAALKAVNDE